MNAKPLIIIVAVVGVAVSGTIYFRAARQHETSDAKWNAITAQHMALEHDLQKAQQRATAADTTRAEIQRAFSALRAAAPDTPVAATKSASSPRPAPRQVSSRDLIMNDPELQALWLRSGRARMALEYTRLFASLHLNAEQAEVFMSNMAKRQEQLMDLDAVAQNQGPEAKAAVAALRQKAESEFHAAQTALLGPEGMRQAQEYERAAPVRTIVSAFAGTATWEGVPLTPEQVGQVESALQRGIPNFTSTGRINLSEIDWVKMDVAMQSVLNPAQFELFKNAGVLNGISRWDAQRDAAVARAIEAERESSPPALPPRG